METVLRYVELIVKPSTTAQDIRSFRIFQETSLTYGNKANRIRTVLFKAMGVFMEMRSSVKHRIRDLTLGKP